MAAESDLEGRFVREVKLLGGIAYKFVSPSRRGVPDRLVVLPEHGHQFFVEFKAPAGRLSPLQQYECAKLAGMGATVYLAWEEKHVKCILDLCRSHTKGKPYASSQSVRTQLSFLTWGSEKLRSRSITSSRNSRDSESEEF